MEKLVVILTGPPGAGKGTQADILAEEYGFFHLESSKVIEAKFANAAADDALLQNEKAKWAAGELNTPVLVREWIMERIERLAAEGRSIVFSGSFRTLYEAEGEVPLVERLYGPEHVHVFHLDITRERSIERNSARRICTANRHPIPSLPGHERLTTCPKDGSQLVKRELDTPETVSVRYDAYLEETAPVLGYFAGRGHSVVRIDGDASIETVHARIVQELELGRPQPPRD
jgi:adenylate kinase